MCAAHLTALAPGTAPNDKAKNIQPCAHSTVPAFQHPPSSMPPTLSCPITTTRYHSWATLCTHSFLKVAPLLPSYSSTLARFASVLPIQEWVDDQFAHCSLTWLFTPQCVWPSHASHTSVTTHLLPIIGSLQTQPPRVTTPSLNIVLKKYAYPWQDCVHTRGGYKLSRACTVTQTIGTISIHMLHMCSCHYITSSILYPPITSIHWLMLCCFLHTPWF